MRTSSRGELDFGNSHFAFRWFLNANCRFVDTTAHSSSPWPTPERTRKDLRDTIFPEEFKLMDYSATAPNSSSPSVRPATSMASTSFSERSLMIPPRPSSERWSPRPSEMETDVLTVPSPLRLPESTSKQSICICIA